MEEDWEAANSVGVRQSNIAMNVSDVPYKPPALDLGDMIDWGEGMNASEMEASDRALHEVNKILEQLLPDVS